MASVGDQHMSGAKLSFNQWLRALREAESDTVKFALLSLIKAVAPTDCTTYEREQILASVGVSFFIRLLKTMKVPEQCSPYMYKSVAVSVLAALLEDPSMTSSDEVKTIAPFLKLNLEILLNPIPEHVDASDIPLMMQDTYSVLSKLACSLDGGQVLIDCAFPRLLVDVLHKLHNTDEQTFVITQAVLVLMQRRFGNKMWKSDVSVFHDYLKFQMHYTAHSKDKDLLNMCKLTAFILSNAPKSGVIGPDEKLLLASLMDKLYFVLSSMVDVSLHARQTVLNLINHLVAHFGMPCLRDEKMYMLVLSLTCIEVRMAVENTTVEEVQKSASHLGMCYAALEVMANYLGSFDEDGKLPMEVNVFTQGHDNLLGVAEGVFYFLKQVDSGVVNIPFWDPIVVASVRMAMTFTCLALPEVVHHFIEILPLLVKLCDYEVDIITKSVTGPVEALSQEFDEACIASTSSEGFENMVEELVMPKTCEELNKLIVPSSTVFNVPPVDVLKILLPVFDCVNENELCRREFVKLEGHRPFIMFLLQIHTKFSARSCETTEKEQLVMDDLLDMLIPLVMVEKRLAVTEPFAKLLDAIISAFPNLNDNLPNMDTCKWSLISTGLGLVHAQHKEQTSLQNQKVFGFACGAAMHICQALRLIFQSDMLKNEPAPKLREMEHHWIVSIDNFSSLIPIFPELVDVFLEGEFLQSAVKILLKHKGNIISEDNFHTLVKFLEVLADRNGKVKEFLKDKKDVHQHISFILEDISR